MSVEHILVYIGWLWSDAINNRTAFAKALIEWTQMSPTERPGQHCGDPLLCGFYDVGSTIWLGCSHSWHSPLSGWKAIIEFAKSGLGLNCISCSRSLFWMDASQRVKTEPLINGGAEVLQLAIDPSRRSTSNRISVVPHCNWFPSAQLWLVPWWPWRLATANIGPYQLMQAQRHSTWTSLQTFVLSSMVILRQNIYIASKTWLNYSTLQNRPVLCIFVQYSVTFGSRPEAASHVISGVFMGQPIVDKVVKFGDPLLNRFRDRAIIFCSFVDVTS